MKNKCLIISCYACTGMNYAVDKLKSKYKIKIIDKYSDFYKRYPTPEIYQRYVLSESRTCDILFIPYFNHMEQRYLKGNVDYYLIYPNIKLKNEYAKRFKDNGFAKDQIASLVDNWDEMIHDCMSYDKSIELQSGEYAYDKILGLLSNINEDIHWDTLLTKPNMYNKRITLYRMGHVKDDKVYPFGRSVGNKLWKGGYSSWWAEQPDETMLHFSQQARALLDDFKEHCYMVAAPDDGRGYKRSVLYLDKEYYYQNLPMFNKIEFYRYTKTFNVKDLHRGQEYAVHEWTYPDIVIPDKVETLHADDCIKNGSVVLVDDLEKIKRKYPNQPKYIADAQDKPWVYHEYSKVKKMLKANKEKGITLNPKYADIFVPPENLKAKILKRKK